MAWAALASAGANIAGGLVGNELSGDERRRSRDLMSEAIGELQKVELPDIEKMKIALEKLQLQGELTPELEQEIKQNPSALLEIGENELYKQTQLDYLKQLRELGNTALTPEERAALNKERQAVSRDVQARDQSVLQSIAARGQLGSGMEIAQRLAASQQGAERQSEESDRLLAEAHSRALQAMQGASNQARTMNEDEYQKALNKAQSINAINQFNTQLAAGTQQRNVGVKNVAQEKNLGEKQRVADTNVNIANQQEQYNKYLPQLQYQNAMQKAQAIANAKLGMSSAAQQEAGRIAGMWAGIGSGASQGISGVAAYNQQQQQNELLQQAIQKSDKNTKTDIKDFDAKKFLDSIEGRVYNYKKEYQSDDQSKKKQIGIMAQDLEKEVPQMVKEDEQGTKMIDYSPKQAGGPIFASLADLHQRLKKLEKKS